jgi:hypothetical protein
MLRAYSLTHFQPLIHYYKTGNVAGWRRELDETQRDLVDTIRKRRDPSLAESPAEQVSAADINWCRELTLTA